MKIVFLFTAILIFVITSKVSGQTSKQTTTHRNCSYVGRPIIDIAGGIVIGKAIKLPLPHLTKNAKKFAQNTTITVKINIDEKGKVISAKAQNENPLLQNLLEQAAHRTKFYPSTVDGKPVQITGQINYKFYQSKVEISCSFDPIEYTPITISNDSFNLLRVFDSRIINVISNYKYGKTINSFNFIKNDQANIQICLSTKTSEIIESIKQTEFELLEESQGNGLVGRIAVENLEKLLEIEEIRFIIPEIP